MSCLRDGIIRDLSLFSDISVKTYCVDFEKRRPPEAFSPKPGAKFIIKWGLDKYKNDWRMDGYSWRQESGKKTICVDGVKIFKYYFKLRIERGETQLSFSTKFSKHAYEHPDYPNQILLIYAGDDSVINPKYSHGNARKLEKTEKAFYRTAASVPITAKERPKDPPAQVHGDLIESAGSHIKIQAVDASRDLEQVRNAQRLAREKNHISHDTQFNAYEVGIDTNFLRKLEYLPSVNMACMEFANSSFGGKRCLVSFTFSMEQMASKQINMIKIQLLNNIKKTLTLYLNVLLTRNRNFLVVPMRSFRTTFFVKTGVLPGMQRPNKIQDKLSLIHGTQFEK
ncbi:uncharacterized protein LOC123466305 isoform X2 [Daphnia magna]|uniref:uncharacterized protein LOC123466305 isoform X2 n=1 Tax=Daphnia magna TaxID=35525 RepID=UPI001E1BBCD0|nr:uncharacterized protein LOC123466305 isoform X2 [Daphnia magna]